MTRSPDKSSFETVADEALFDGEGGFWVFAYGSLLWRPGFAPAARIEARLDGYARRFCLWSHRYRGTPERPGLVLGLDEDPSATTRGVVYRVPPERAAQTRAYLHEREMVTGAYREMMAPVAVLGAPPRCGRTPPPQGALTYVIDRDHAQYAGVLCLDRQAAIIAGGHGKMGPNRDYLFNTVAHLRKIGLDAGELDGLDELEARVRRLSQAPSEASRVQEA